MYNTGNEHIKILFKDGTVKDISEIEYVLIKLVADGPAKKFYLCHPETYHKMKSRIIPGWKKQRL